MRNRAASAIAALFVAALFGTESLAQSEPESLPSGAIGRLGTRRFRHSAPSALAYSPDGRILASAAEFGDLRLWEAPSGKLLRKFLGRESERPMAFSFSPDGKTIASVWQMFDRRIRVWNVETGEMVVDRPFDKGGFLSIAAFSPDLKLVAGAVSAVNKEGLIRVWSVDTGKQLVEIKAHRQHFFSLAFSPDGKTLASTGYQDPVLRFWDVASGKETRTLDSGVETPASLTWSPDGKRVAWVDNTDFKGKQESTLRVWDWESGKEVARLNAGSNLVYRLEFSADGKALASLGYRERTARLWDWSAGKPLLEIDVASTVPSVGQMACLTFSPDGRTLAVGSQEIGLWDAATGRNLTPRQGHRAAVISVRVLADGKETVSVDLDGGVRRWDARGNEIARNEFPGVVSSSAVSPDGTRVILGDGGGSAQVRELQTDRKLLTLDTCRPNVRTSVSSAGFSPDGKRIATWSNLFRMWNAETGEMLWEIEDHGGIFSPDGRFLASPGPRGIVVRDAATGRELTLLSGGKFRIAAVAFSPDGRTLAVGRSTEIVGPRYSSKNGRAEQHALQLWEVAGGKEILLREGPAESFSALTFSPDGRTIASASPQGTVRLWDADTLLERRVLRGHDGAVFALAFSPDGATLASGGQDTTILLWDAAVGKPPGGAKAAGPDEIRKLVAELGVADAAAARAAMMRLAAAGDESVPILKETVGTPSDSGPKVAALIGNLDHDMPEVRERTAQELQEFGIQAAAVLRRTRETASNKEIQSRAQEILARMDGPILRSAELLARHRAIEALERIGSAAAREILRETAASSPLERERREASAALDRLRKWTRP